MISKEELEELFLNKNLTRQQIADIYKISKNHVVYLLKKYNIRKSQELKNATMKRISSTPEMRKLKSINCKNAWNNKTSRANILEGLHKKFSDSKFRESMRGRTCSEHTRQLKSINGKRIWNNNQKRRDQNTKSYYKGDHLDIWMDKDKFINKCKELKYLCLMIDYFKVHSNSIMYKLKSLNADISFLEKRKSLGEAKICFILKENNIKFIEQKWFSDCRDILPLPFDFYLPDLDICIEFQGQQHYEPVKFGKMSDFQAENNFKRLRYHDDIKKNYCLNNRIKLIEIKYDEDIAKKLEMEIFHDRNFKHIDSINCF